MIQPPTHSAGQAVPSACMPFVLFCYSGFAITSPFIPPSLNRNNIPSKVSDDDAKRISSSLPLCCSIKTPSIPIFMRLMMATFFTNHGK